MKAYVTYDYIRNHDKMHETFEYSLTKEQFDVAIELLTQITEGDLSNINQSCGICNSLDRAMNKGNSKYSCGYAVVSTLALGWEHHSGNPSYPITDVPRDPKWKDKALELRKSLAAHLINKLKGLVKTKVKPNVQPKVKPNVQPKVKPNVQPKENKMRTRRQFDVNFKLMIIRKANDPSNKKGDIKRLLKEYGIGSNVLCYWRKQHAQGHFSSERAVAFSRKKVMTHG